MKKLISFFLCALTLVSLSLTAFAAPAAESKGNSPIFPAGSNKPGAEVQDATHKHNWVWQYSTNGGYKVSNSGCAAIIWHHAECACGATDDSRIIEPEKPHSGGTLYNATCNGADQTWYYTSCSRCGHYYTETHACLGKDHKSGCRWLPV